ncbi:MAG: RNA 2',3'-cyclic phosphodiesterase [marine benthic group bacterium]|nr:RNA 2',3'-cyclic phosphodiesterase [Candidatus Benthicola marisminoris]
MRLFVAVNFPARLRQKIARLCRPLEDAGVPGRWTEADQVHLTLKFIGEVPATDVEPISEALQQVAGSFRPFEMRFGPIGAFPSPRRPRVVWLGVEQTPELRFIKDDLERRLAELGIAREARPYQPHVTLGRAPREAEAGEFRRLEEVARSLRVGDAYKVTHLDLMKSKLGAEGPVHTRLVLARLGARA